jgi:hypothetical protein
VPLTNFDMQLISIFFAIVAGFFILFSFRVKLKLDSLLDKKELKKFLETTKGVA